MILNELTDFWRTSFNDVPPISDELKHLFQSRWVRFHSLPESKRYPDCESEYQEILFRHHHLIENVCDSPSDLIVVFQEYSDQQNFEQFPDSLIDFFPLLQHWKTVLNEKLLSDEENFYSHFYVQKIDYFLNKQKISNLLRQIADAEMYSVMLIDLNSKVVFHPYDGGIDIIVETEQERNQLKAQYSHWLSKHPEGY